MGEYWREILYPLGFLSALAFSSRTLMQWMVSESKSKSIVTPTFWQLSLCGNLLLAFHSFVQIQFHVCIVQVCNAVISWRNLNLMKPVPKQVSIKFVLYMFVFAVLVVVSAFKLQGFFLNKQDWFRIPMNSWQLMGDALISKKWHLVGSLGLVIFNSRFWLQWWFAEKYRQSYLGKTFWYISLIGELLCLIYFLRIGDPVNFIGPVFGTIPSVRNLILIYKSNKQISQRLG